MQGLKNFCEKYKMPKLVLFMGHYETEHGGSGVIRKQEGENGSLYELDVKMSGKMKSGTDPKTGRYAVDSNSNLARVYSYCFYMGIIGVAE
jgi:hypothetical protein